MDSLPKYLWKKILSYNCFVDRISCKFSCKFFKVLFEDERLKDLLNFHKIYMEKLSLFIDNSQEFHEKMLEYQCSVSGSFILHCLYSGECSDNNFVPNDIDIYDERKFMVNEEKDYSSFSKYLYDISPDCKGQRCTSGNISLMISNYFEVWKDLKKFKINLIYVSKNVYNFVERLFDINLCKNVYNTSLKIYDWNVLFERKDFIMPNVLIFSNYYAHLEKDMKSYKRVYDERIRKYNERNFKIEKSPNFFQIIEELKKEGDEIYEEREMFHELLLEGKITFKF